MDLTALEYEKRENRFSGILASLTSCESFSRSLVQRLFDPTEATPGAWHFRPQIQTGDGIADIVIEGPSCLAVVEAKLGAGFDEGQPANYATYLMNCRSAAPGLDARLVLLVPEPRISELEQVARERLKEKDLDVRLVMLSWEETADLALAARGQANPDERGFLDAYIELIQTSVGKIPHPLTQAELSLVNGWEGRNLFSELTQLLRLVPIKLKDTFGDELGVGQLAAGSFFFGLWVKYRSREWWFGCWLDAWIKFGKSLLWLQSTGRLLTLPPALASNVGVREYKNTSVCPLQLVPYLDRQSQATQLAEVCKRIIVAEEENSAK